MSVLPPPEEVRATFTDYLNAGNPEGAVHYLYQLGVDHDYIKVEAIAKNIHWETPTEYGNLEITVNLSKPEKDPKDIVAQAKAKAKAAAEPADTGGLPVPLCDLCWNNEDFPGTPDHPAKPGLRVCAITLGGETWGFQFSPYAYFEEHCIALSEDHRPMKISQENIRRLFDFVDIFPFYFIGSNADIPIVGGSILSHDHFQGGRHVFPLMKAPVEREFELSEFPDIHAGIVHWPSSVIRLRSTDRDAMIQAAGSILDAWKGFDDEACHIFAGTDVQHNTLNPIVHRENDEYVLDLVLRNNITTEERPFGLFHPDESLFHIKKENIGLIEIMGLAILPPRLVRELPAAQRILYACAQEQKSPGSAYLRLKADPDAEPHALWASNFYKERQFDIEAEANQECDWADYGGIGPIMREEVGRVFEQVLDATGVFKHDDTGAAGWNHFLERIQ